MKKFISALMTLALAFFIFSLLYDPESFFPKYGERDLNNTVSQKYIEKNVDETRPFPETGSANIVTSVVVNYRGFDTLGELTVLFISAMGVALLLNVGKERIVFRVKPNFILKAGVRIITGIILIVGIYIFIHGHLTPGGGFPGGAMIASSVLLMYISDDKFKEKMNAFNVLEGTSGVLVIVLGLIGLFAFNSFLYNFLPSGEIGQLFSAGLTPILYVLIGLKVGSELSNIIGNFLTQGGEE
ncbi:cation:proton antiporter [Petrotoga sp. 9T1HF07.CasAA.8.2]|uniref:Na(+)/H(+) antiporter subunit B n=1 Tax=Petrotoga sp. 9T1HF07.CasAA.8.2 TaxID=1434329 RepID=UPI000CB2EE74|nr:Na(+)/H(+) antiporter subunit B [Petrotoga sp. 9T1HF07.CasAA.8.2]PNR88224.1 cation:proton antiporter [Petrotoga sp. 9T1HF07.CasAA.8.2]